MDKLQFTVPVRIKADPTAHVSEIYDVDDALTFLQNWETGRLGPVYQTAMSSCFAAKVNEVTAEQARNDFLNFAQVAGILAKDDAPSTVPEGENGLKPVPK
ncbi:DUF982 domain-containing protein [Mesorhizobium sp. CGMCC 1.15528]|uniref:DUF982 domain-containing protein n=1 Tax=Mesorhizobium zhangyense TaxID=1776730 RepID=A0A7C9V782_9HYPH|nr:DUF982 domain-containing protein [Mesorhizobium zhangyense]NGN41523.1 DUF982 domain-containing protein [Mesorhizobium zhangyense]